jgi:glycerol kinase
MTGAFVDWLVDSLELVESTGGVHAVPAISGLAAP